MIDSNRQTESAGREDPPRVRFSLRIVLGLFGGLFLSGVLFLLLWYSFDPRRESPAAMAALLGFVLGAPAVGFGAFAPSAPVRILAWAIAGAGFGDFLLACMADGLGVGTVLTPSGLVMALVCAILGYRAVPPRK